MANNNNNNNMTWWGAEGVDLLGLDKPSEEERLTQLESHIRRSQALLNNEWDFMHRLNVYRERQEEADQKKRKEELESWKKEKAELTASLDIIRRRQERKRNEERESWKKEKAELTASLESSNAILNAVTWGMFALTFMTIARVVVGRR